MFGDVKFVWLFFIFDIRFMYIRLTTVFCINWYVEDFAVDPSHAKNSVNSAFSFVHSEVGSYLFPRK